MKKNKSISTTTVIWIILIGATIVSFSLVENFSVARIAVSVAVAIAIFKARLIFIHFMELKRGIIPYRIIYEAWAIIAFIVILGGYWYTELRF